VNGCSTDVSQLGKVAVLFGGASSEREVSLMSGQGVLQALRSKGVDAHAFDPSERDLSELKRAGFDRCFIAMHGRGGEDGSLQGALEVLGLPYTGSGVMASAVAMDKVTTKRLWRDAGLPTPAFEVLSDGSDLHGVPERLGLPLMLKAPHEGSTIGIAKIGDAQAMGAGFAACRRYDRQILAEAFVPGRELTVAVLEDDTGCARALPIVEIVAPGGNYDFQHKYYSDDTRYHCPADLPPDLATRIQTLSEQAFAVVGCRGWGRVDVMLREADQSPFLLEINTSPGMTGHSLVPMAAQAAGLRYADLCVRILAMARTDAGAARSSGAPA
jgi:D-alanine-D-alanine ligase